MVVGTSCRASSWPVAVSTRAALVNVEPKSTQRTVYTAGEPVERLRQVRDEVLDVLDPDGEPDQVGGDLELGARDRGVRHAGWVLDEGLDPPERLAQCPDLGLGADLDCDVLAGLELERDHPAEAPHLLRCRLVAAVAPQGRVVHRTHC